MSQGQRNFKVEHRGNGNRVPFKPKPKRWSHQQELETLKGKEIWIRFTTSISDSMRGTLIDADQFTIKVEFGGAFPHTETFFKHSIHSYQAA